MKLEPKEIGLVSEPHGRLRVGFPIAQLKEGSITLKGYQS